MTLKTIISPRILTTCAVAIALAFSSGAAQAFQLADDSDDAQSVLAAVHEAYANVPALTDEMATHFSMSDRPDEKSTIKIRLSQDAAQATGIVPPQELSIYEVDGFLYLQLKGANGAVQAELGDEPLATAKDVMGIAYPFLPPQLALRWSGGKDVQANWFALGMLTDCELAGYDIRGKGADKRYVVRITGAAPLLMGRPGTCYVAFDFETKLLRTITIAGGTDGNEPNFRMTAECQPQVMETLAEPIAFEMTEDSTRFHNFKAMLNVMLGGGTSVDPSIQVGTAAPDFELRDQDGKAHKLSDYAGKYVMLDWWGSWCAPCVRDLPKLQALHEKHAAGGDVVFLAMNVRDDNEKMEQFWSDGGYTFASLHDADELVETFGVKAFPSAILIGPDGKVLHVEAGPASDLADVLEKALDKTHNVGG